ncbi:hypothetical protein PRNP1_009382 [Phytophthora ramorum]
MRVRRGTMPNTELIVEKLSLEKLKEQALVDVAAVRPEQVQGAQACFGAQHLLPAARGLSSRTAWSCRPLDKSTGIYCSSGGRCSTRAYLDIHRPDYMLHEPQAEVAAAVVELTTIASLLACNRSLVLGMHSSVGLQDALTSSSEFPTGSAERCYRRAAECQALCASVMFVNEANVKT